MFTLNGHEVEKHLDMAGCIELMKQTLIAVENKTCTQFIRQVVPLPNGNVMGYMTAYFEDGYFGSKVLSVYPQNSKDGYPSHQGQILLFENTHGVLEAMVDATSVTKIRTGAVSGVATDLLAKKDAKTLALLGCGHQAESHLEAITHVRKIETIYVWDMNEEKALAFKALYPQHHIIVSKTAKEAVQDADIVCTLTPSKTPIVEYAWLKEGAHVNAVGACQATSREVDTAIMKNAKVYGDQFASIMKESGDFLIPLQEGAYDESHYQGDIAQLLLGKVAGRSNDQELTVFDALGLACEDVASVHYLKGKLNNG